MKKTSIVLGLTLWVAGCGQSQPQQNDNFRTLPAHRNDATPPSPPEPHPQPAAGTNEAAPLSEPQGPIDPKSTEAAGQVVQSFGALIEQNRWRDANALWGDPAAAAKFHASLADAADLHLEIGNPGDPEGAAGSIYVTVPAIFYGDLKNGQEFRRSADVTLRRVNDVPGSTDAQRRWHIERIAWAS
jgi:hypothetical protein